MIPTLRPVYVSAVSIIGIGTMLMLVNFYDSQISLKLIVDPAATVLSVIPSGVGHLDGAATSEVSDLEDERNAPGFLVHSSKCSIPDINPRHPSILRYIKKKKKISCTLAPPLTTVQRTTLLYHPEHAGDNIKAFVKKEKEKGKGKKYEVDVSRSDPVSCYYRSLRRVTLPPTVQDHDCDDNYEIDEKHVPITEAETSIPDEGILVVCKAKGYMVYKNVHIFVQRDLLLDRRLQNIELFNDFKRLHPNASRMESTQNPSNGSTPSPNEDPAGQKDSVTVSYDKTNPLPLEERLNVIMFMTDAVSRLNFYRQMPKTIEFLTRLGAIDMAGFNKVADNTYPNLLVSLTGISKEKIEEHPCHTQRRVKVFDDCPLVWKEFRRNGYVTGFMEDAPWMGTFNYNNPGFHAQPTEFYPRPFFRISEDEIAWKHKGNANYCQGPRMSMRMVQEGTLAMAEAFPDIPFFGLFITSSVTHDSLNRARDADIPHLKFLHELQDMGTLNKTVLVFFSDHGQRWGSIRSTLVGMMEERLPFMFFLLPAWFRDRYPKAYKNVRTNTRRLTSNYDIHTTLRDIAFGHYANEDYVMSTPMPSRGISLFQKVPKERSCEDAGIPDHFCTCYQVKHLPLNDTVALKGADFVMSKLNKDLRNYTQCVQFTKVELLSAGISESGEALKPEGKSDVMRTYVVQALLAPGGAKIEASFQYSPDKERFALAGEVSRINAYGSQSHCISDSVLRKYCYCRDILRNE